MKALSGIARFAAAASLFAFAPATAAALPDADPAIWKVRDADTTIYLFGTFHALDGKSDWFNEEVRAAFDEAAELVLEIPPVDDPASLQPVLAKYAMAPSGPSLTEKLSPATRAKFLKALASLGAPPQAFDKAQPFFAMLMLVMLQAQKLGLTAENGAEAVLTKAAKSAGKPVGALETMEFQMSLFAGMTDADQITLLEQTLDQWDDVETTFAGMNAAWVKGDEAGLAQITNQMNGASAELYKVIFTNRNNHWAEWVDQRLDRPGTVFLAVGAGHLVGKDSVQQILAKRGITSQRVKPH
jgi:uncharacterized protein YbaP (TraB family)